MRDELLALVVKTSHKQEQMIQKLEETVRQREHELAHQLTLVCAELGVAQCERDRLLILATKHCPKSHHDWEEIMSYDMTLIYN